MTGQPHGGMLHDMTSPALTRGPYAKRHMVWPPAGFVEPTLAELAGVVHRLKNPGTWSAYLLKRKPTEELNRHLQVIEWFHDHPELSRSDSYIHAIRRELTSRPDAPVFRSLHRPRCSMCSHTTDRTWEATSETHDIVREDDTPWTGFLCARCWSDYLKEA